MAIGLINGVMKVNGITYSHLDTTHSPVALWKGDGALTDSSGNGFTLTVAAGTERYGYILPGVKGFLVDGATRLEKSYDATLNILGDVTFEAIIAFEYTASHIQILEWTGDVTSETEANNGIYGIRLNDTAEFLYGHEYSGGTNQLYEDDKACYVWGQPQLVGFTRTSGVVQFYVNGVAIGAASSALTAPTGGTSAKATIGQRTNATGPAIGGIASVKICNSALTAAQMLAEAQLVGLA